MKIKLTTVHVDDQEKALRFYTEVLGFVKKADFSQGPFRWLTWPHQRTRTARSCNWRPTTTRRPKPPAGDIPAKPAAAMFFTDYVQADYERMKGAAPSSPCRQGT